MTAENNVHPLPQDDRPETLLFPQRDRLTRLEAFLDTLQYLLDERSEELPETILYLSRRARIEAKSLRAEMRHKGPRDR
jgi:hypothetical protein